MANHAVRTGCDIGQAQGWLFNDPGHREARGEVDRVLNVVEAQADGRADPDARWD